MPVSVNEKHLSLTHFGFYFVFKYLITNNLLFLLIPKTDVGKCYISCRKNVLTLKGNPVIGNLLKQML
ncbi:hypothetical protein DIU36_22935 [Mucilaginibacter rubeus]|nr:hypothetical protein DIU36_22935 [Mucilaginibacter rubeus]